MYINLTVYKIYNFRTKYLLLLSKIFYLALYIKCLNILHVIIYTQAFKINFTTSTIIICLQA